MLSLASLLFALEPFMVNNHEELNAYHFAVVLTTGALLLGGIHLARVMKGAATWPRRRYGLVAEILTACWVAVWIVRSSPLDLRLLVLLSGAHGIVWGIRLLELAIRSMPVAFRSAMLSLLAAGTSAAGIALAVQSNLTRTTALNWAACYTMYIGLVLVSLEMCLYRSRIHQEEAIVVKQISKTDSAHSSYSYLVKKLFLRRFLISNTLLTGRPNLGLKMQKRGIVLASLPLVLILTSLTQTARAVDVKGKVSAQGIRSPENIVVYIDTIVGQSFPKPTQHPAMDQHHLAFIPHVLPVLQGTTVDFKNDDAVGHNVFWPSINHNRKLAGNLGTWPQGGVKSYTFNDLGEVPLLCNVHPEMSAYIFVVPTPYFAVTDKEGNFTIRDVPAGQYTLKTWSEEAKPSAQPVTAGSGTVTVNITVKK